MSERVTAVERDRLVFDVLDEGPLDGEPIVLLHGFPERSTAWRYVVPLLNEAGYRTLAMDQRGYSPRARPGRRRDYRVSELVADAAALVERVGGRAHVVGHDWGSAVGWNLAIRFPQRVRTLTAVSVPHPRAFFESFLRSDQLLRSWYMGFFQLPAVPERLARTRVFEDGLRKGGAAEADIERFRREIVDDGALSPALNWYRALPFNDPRTIPTTVRVPTTLVWSDQDVALGRWAVDRTEQYVDAPYRLVVLEGVSHWIPSEAPDALAEAILDRVAG